MRKRISSLLFVTLISFPTLAQNIQGSYRPKADGEIRKQQVEYTVSEAMGENIVWDFSSMEQPDEDYTVKYTLAETGGNDSIIVGKEQQTRYYYRSDVDSVMLCGYETNLTKVQQTLMDDDENAEIRRLLAAYDSQHAGNNNGSDDNSDSSYKTLDARNVHVNVNGHTIAVSYELVKDATVTALVCDVSGILYQQASHNGTAGENCEMTVCCDGLRSGQYVLYLNVNGQVTSYTVHL